MTRPKQTMLRLDFEYGNQYWDFAYITVYFIQAMRIGPALVKNLRPNLKWYEELGVFQMIGEVEKARVQKTGIHINPIQCMEFISSADELSAFIVHELGPEFLEEFVRKLSVRFDKYTDPLEVEKMYLPIASDYIAAFKENYSKTPAGRRMLEYAWSTKFDYLVLPPDLLDDAERGA